MNQVKRVWSPQASVAVFAAYAAAVTAAIAAAVAVVVVAAAAAGAVQSEAPQHTARLPRHIPTHRPENPVHMSIYDAGLVAAIEEASAQQFFEARPRPLRTAHPSWNSSWRVIANSRSPPVLYTQRGPVCGRARDAAAARASAVIGAIDPFQRPTNFQYLFMNTQRKENFYIKSMLF